MNQDLNEEVYFNGQRKIHLNKFLYDFALSKLKYYDSSRYTSESYGSWFILIGKKLILYDGKENFLIMQNQTFNVWKTQRILNEEELNYLNFIEIVNLSQME
jgi:hypothetical protein